MATGFRQVLAQLQQADGRLTDGQLLGRFVGARDEAAFAALVRRHGPMVFGVCRRVLGDFHDAEDAFQATFLVLARKAGSVAKRDSLGCWLYQVAYHTALEAGMGNARRRSREKPVGDLPHPVVVPAEAPDWRSALDRELSLLPERYRAAIVACDLEGRTRREAARQLGVTEGTLSSRLARGRTLLAKRLTKCGVTLSGGALAVALSKEASAAVPAGLVSSTAKAAALMAAGQVAAVSTTAVLLMKGVTKMMLLKKLRVVAGVVVVLAALGMVGVGYQSGGGLGSAQAAPPDKPKNELDALRRENELLKLNLEVVLEKVRAQENEIQGLRKEVASRDLKGKGRAAGAALLDFDSDGFPDLYVANGSLLSRNKDGTFSVQPLSRDDIAGAAKEADEAIKALREAKDKEGQRRATAALEKALEKLKQGKNKPQNGQRGQK
jgi:RNA polymerase sigma factor (sigma-70 family)